MAPFIENMLKEKYVSKETLRELVKDYVEYAANMRENEHGYHSPDEALVLAQAYEYCAILLQNVINGK